MTPEELQHTLAHYTGTETWWKHPFNRTCTFTDGVKAFADHAGAYWLLDILMTEPAIIQNMRKHGLIIELAVADGKGTLTARADNDQPYLFNRAIPFTDCPSGTWRFFFFNNVLMLPSEY